MEHRHDGQYHVPAGQPHGIGHHGGVGVQHGGAVRVQHALGVASGAGGVTQGAGGILIQLRPLEYPVARGHQGLVALHPGQAGPGHVRFIGEDNPAFHPGTLGRDALHQRQEVGVEKHVLIFGVIDDVGHLLREQSRVDGVAYIAAAGGGVVGFEMAVVVPGQGGDTVTLREPPAGKAVGQLAGAKEGVAIGIAVAGVVAGDRDYLDVAVDALSVLHDGSDRQGYVHHKAVHLEYSYY